MNNLFLSITLLISAVPAYSMHTMAKIASRFLPKTTTLALFGLHSDDYQELRANFNELRASKPDFKNGEDPVEFMKKRSLKADTVLFDKYLGGSVLKEGPTPFLGGNGSEWAECITNNTSTPFKTNIDSFCSYTDGKNFYTGPMPEEFYRANLSGTLTFGATSEFIQIARAKILERELLDIAGIGLSLSDYIENRQAGTIIAPGFKFDTKTKHYCIIE